MEKKSLLFGASTRRAPSPKVRPMITSQLHSTVDYLRTRTPVTPNVALILGSGLGAIADQIDGEQIPYQSIPGFPQSTAPSHTGTLHIGHSGGVPVVAMQGRLHMYEGYTPQQVVFPMQVMAALGASTLIVTNAAGGLNPDYHAGELVLIEDHLSLPGLAGGDPLRGTNDDTLGPRFLSLNGAYSRALQKLVDRAAETAGTPPLKRGVYGFVVGPSLETPAEVRALRALGCDLVGMSTVPEVIAARHAGLEVLGISAVANMAISDLDDENVTSAEAVFATMTTISPKLQTLLEQIMPLLANRQPS